MLRTISRRFQKSALTTDSLVKDFIKNNGSMSVNEYVRMCSQGGGYYSAKESIIGAKGDFITSPGISIMRYFTGRNKPAFWRSIATRNI
jgi:hypothetical protein